MTKVIKVTKTSNQSFSNSVSNDDSQSIDKHMTKFKGPLSTRQYARNKPSKCCLRFLYCCASETGHLCQFDFYLGKKESSAEENLGPCVVLKMTKSLQNSHCMCFFDNLFNIL